jgi:hypothetical protein
MGAWVWEGGVGADDEDSSEDRGQGVSELQEDVGRV